MLAGVVNHFRRFPRENLVGTRARLWSEAILNEERLIDLPRGMSKWPDAGNEKHSVINALKRSELGSHTKKRSRGPNPQERFSLGKTSQTETYFFYRLADVP